MPVINTHCITSPGNGGCIYSDLFGGPTIIDFSCIGTNEKVLHIVDVWLGYKMFGVQFSLIQNIGIIGKVTVHRDCVNLTMACLGNSYLFVKYKYCFICIIFHWCTWRWNDLKPFRKYEHYQIVQNGPTQTIK